jgi:hypothetical protein
VNYDGSFIALARHDGIMEDEYYKGAVDAICDGEQDIPRKPV